MTHHFQIPAYPLNKFIAGFVYYKGFTALHTIDRYLPNGNTEIIINLTETPKYIYDNQTLKENQACKKVWVSGIRTQFISIPSGTGSEMFIIEFKKGMAGPFIGKLLTELTNTVAEADLVLHPVFLTLREQLLEQPTVTGMFHTAEQMLLRQFQKKLAINPFIDFAVNTIMANPGRLSMKALADKTGYSPKHLIKIFNDHVGLTPKSFLRIIRFQNAIREIEVRGNTNWISLANDCGYYDQAHMIGNFKEFSGFTPMEYMQKRGNTGLDYIPVG